MASATKRERSGFRGALPALLAGLLGLGVSAGLSAATFVVDSTADAVDNNLEDGTCAVEGGGCTLRAAIMQANALAGADVIQLTGLNDPANPIVLSIAGEGPDDGWLAVDGDPPYAVESAPDAAFGDLDILEDLAIEGDPGLTWITWAAGVPADGRIFHLQAPAGVTVGLISISNVVVTGGSLSNEIIEHISCGVEPGPEPPDEGPPQPPTEGDWVLKRMGGGIAIGPGAGIANTCVSGGDEGGMPGDVGPPDDHDEEEGGITAVVFERVVAAGNQAASDGGGIHVAAPMTLGQSIIANNLSGANGGGLYLDTGSTIVDTTIGGVSDPATAQLFLGTEDAARVTALMDLVGLGNTAENGGGIFDTGSHTTAITRSAINGNSATGGGGIAARALITINITNSTVSGNAAFDVGGGITTNGTVNLVNVTVSDNTASSDAFGGGGGLNSFGGGTYTLLNTLIYKNTMGGASTEPHAEEEPVSELRDINCGCTGTENCPGGVFVTRGHNLENVNTCSLGVDDLADTDALLQPLAANGWITETHALPLPPLMGGTGSPAVDAGNEGQCPNNDQRGTIRSDDGDLNDTFLCDIGAFELFIPRTDLHVNNATAPDVIGKGEQFTLHVQVHNDFANILAEGVRVLVTVPGGLDLLSAQWALAGGALSTCGDDGGGKVSCDIGSMEVAETADVWLEIASRGTVIFSGPPVTYELPVAMDSTSMDLVLGNNVATPGVKVLGRSDLVATVNASATEVDAFSPVTLAYAITNNGEDLASAMKFGMDLPAGVSVESLVPGEPACRDAGGAVVCRLANLAAGGSTDVELVLLPQVAGTFGLLASASAEQSDANPADNEVLTELTSVAIADCALSGRANAAQVTVGSRVTVTLTATNAGPMAALDPAITGTLPAGVRFVSGAGCSVAGTALTCSGGDSMAVGETASFDVVLTTTTAGTKTASLSLLSSTKDPVAANDTASVSFTAVNPPHDDGGCVANPDAPFDPTLVVLLALALTGLAVRRQAG